jgi:branched-chain amino acid transport system permease protein
VFNLRYRKHTKLLSIVLAIIILALVPVFISSPYYLDLFITAISSAILAMTFITCLRVGLINLSTAAFWGIGAYTTAILVVNFHFSFWVSLPISGLLAGIIGWGLSYILIGKRTSAFSFVMLSSVLGTLFPLAVGNIEYLGGFNGIANIPEPETIKIFSLATIEFNSRIPYFYLILIIAVIIILALASCYSNWAGRSWTSIGLDARLAESIGINSFRFRMFAFVLSSVIAGLIGSFYATYQGFIINTSFGMWKTIFVQIYAILGGVSYAILGPIVGSALMTVFIELLRPIDVISPIVIGAILMLLIVFLPQGILGLLEYKNLFKHSPHNTVNILKLISSTFNFKRD